MEFLCLIMTIETGTAQNHFEHFGLPVVKWDPGPSEQIKKYNKMNNKMLNTTFYLIWSSCGKMGL